MYRHLKVPEYCGVKVVLRRASYALIGSLLSMGAPIGLLAIRSWQHRTGSRVLRRVPKEMAGDAVGYAYVGLSTAIAFTLFGVLLGRQADRLVELSRSDGLTRLRNARGLLEQLEKELARFARYGEPLALLLVDLDGLKQINDRFGHRAGDVALCYVADAIRAESRATDTSARWGGDEFAILAPNTSETAALSLAERVRARIARQRDLCRLTASIGVAAIDTQSNRKLDPARFFNLADLALYDAKHRGRDTVACTSSAQVDRSDSPQ
jgi:diguanylate cyclase (GGDEF)-like protein